jgi:hypothetical protein
VVLAVAVLAQRLAAGALEVEARGVSPTSALQMINASAKHALDGLLGTYLFNPLRNILPSRKA